MKKIALKYGLFMYAGFALLFLIVHLLGFSERYNLRILNGVIHLAFIYFAIRDYRKIFPESFGNYLSGVAAGMYTSFIGVVLFAFSMCLFLALNQPFFEELRAQTPIPSYFTPVTASLYIFSEGIVVSLIGSYIVMRIVDARIEEAREQ